MATSDRGFAGMPLAKRQELASLGGKAAHAKGTGHEWNSEQAREAGRKGAAARRANKAAREQVQP